MFTIIINFLTSLLVMMSGSEQGVKPPAEKQPSKFDWRLPSLSVEDMEALKPFFEPPIAKPSEISSSRQITALRRAIIGQESGGNFRAINPDSGALGYGQLMEFNVAPWTKAALGRALTPEEFLANPDAQIKTIDYKLNEYLQLEFALMGSKNEELAIRRVASTWYCGNPNLWSNTRPQYYKGRPYPSIASYTASVWRRYQREIA